MVLVVFLRYCCVFKDGVQENSVVLFIWGYLGVVEGVYQECQKACLVICIWRLGRYLGCKDRGGGNIWRFLSGYLWDLHIHM